MRSALPKVLHPAAGIPLLDRVLGTASSLGGRIVVVAGAGKDGVLAHLARTWTSIVPVVQDPPRGTGDAIRVASSAFGDASNVVVLSGDVPLLTAETVSRLVARLKAPTRPAVAFVTMVLEAPAGYGRVVRGVSGEVSRIVEAKDASEEELAIREVNAGVYAFERAFLDRALPGLGNDNAQGEYYLTDVLGLAVTAGRAVEGIRVGEPREVLGVNSKKELAEVDAHLRERAVLAALDAGATLVKPETITLDETVVLGQDAVVEPFATLTGRTRVGRGSRIGQGCVLHDTEVGENVVFRPYCVVDGARIGDGAVVGPFARLREGTELAEGVHVGNFVETKKARLGRGAKANHLAYIGDAEIGERTNVGAGVITCNYDGFAKNRTVIGAGVFVGSDVQLVAPVTVGDGAVVGAGTTVTEDVPADAMAVSRVPQKNLLGRGASYRARKSAAREKA
jgi:bifunctional UDP-N-acetylglucosamine pyrophosphorylase/glucosamine-1-phosphate N-acetyltransferase